MISSLRCVVDPSPGGVVETCKRFPGGCNCCKMLLRNSCITWYKKAQNLKHNVRYMFENYLLILACLALYRHFFLTCLVRQIWVKHTHSIGSEHNFSRWVAMTHRTRENIQLFSSLKFCRSTSSPQQKQSE